MEPILQCPGCELLLPADDLLAQKAHMEAEHPEIIKRRLDESARWDGWEDS